MFRASVLGGTGLALLCLMVPPTKHWHFLLLVLAGVGGAICAYISIRRSLISNRIEKSAVIGGVVGVVAGLLCFGIHAFVLSVTGNIQVVLNLRSLNLAIIGVTQLTLSSAFGGLIAGILLRWYASWTTVGKDQ